MGLEGAVGPPQPPAPPPKKKNSNFGLL